MHDTKPQLFIMDERLGDPIPLAEIKEISEPTLDEEYDMPDISHLKEGFEIPFENEEICHKQTVSTVFWQRTLQESRKMCQVHTEKGLRCGENREQFQHEIKGIPPLIINHKEDTNGRERKETVETARSGTFTRSDSVCHAGF